MPGHPWDRLRHLHAPAGVSANHIGGVKSVGPRRYTSSHLGIIYCASKKDTEVLAEQLRSKGMAAAHYHADVEAQQRQHTHRAWSDGEGKCCSGACQTWLVQLFDHCDRLWSVQARNARFAGPAVCHSDPLANLGRSWTSRAECAHLQGTYRSSRQPQRLAWA